METTRYIFQPNVKRFFYNLGEYLDTTLLYYGSVQRFDYIPGKSDIDVLIFTNNEYSTITKMQHYLHVNKTEFKKVVWQLGDSMTYGYKLQYIHPTEQIIAEFSIYNNRFKDIIHPEYTNKLVLPLYITCLLYIIKFCHYKIQIVTKKQYSTIKRFILNTLMGTDTKFLLL
jgi:hypothetical protein